MSAYNNNYCLQSIKFKQEKVFMFTLPKQIVWLEKEQYDQGAHCSLVH